MTNAILISLIVLASAFLIFSIICATKESAVTAKYEGVYGKLSARIATSFTFFGFVILVFSLLLVLIPGFKEGLGEDIMPTGVILAFGAVCLGVGLIAFKLALNKCPKELKKGCIRAMIITAIGSSLKQIFKISSKTGEIAGEYAKSTKVNFAKSYLGGGDPTKNIYDFYESMGDTQARLRNYYTGEIVTVYSNYSSDGTLTDSAGNLYYPQ